MVFMFFARWTARVHRMNAVEWVRRMYSFGSNYLTYQKRSSDLLVLRELSGRMIRGEDRRNPSCGNSASKPCSWSGVKSARRRPQLP
jgi:hypothetical protein